MKKTTMTKLTKLTLLTLGATALLSSSTAFASAYQLFEQDIADLGNYHAGNGATADTAATEYTNPAGMVRLKEAQISTGGAAIMPDIQFSGTIFDNPSTPVNNAQGGSTVFVPNFHIAAPIDDRWAAGFGITVPFGLQTNYGGGDAASYIATLSSIKTINVGPNLAYALTKKFSVGVGFDAQYLQGEFNQFSQSQAGYSVINKASGMGYGWNIGMLYQFNDATRVGLTYRSQINYTAKGTSTVNGGGGIPTFTSSLSAVTATPATTTLSGFHALNKTWDLLATINYTQWNVVHDLTMRGVSNPLYGVIGGQPSTLTVSLPQRFKNTWNLDLGANYHLNDRGLLRFGVGYDQSPVNQSDRNLRLPDSDRIAAATCFHYQLMKNLGIDFSYAHLFMLPATINNTVPTGVENVPGQDRYAEQGRIVASADIIGAQINYKFS